MSKLNTEEWNTAKPPFYWIRTKYVSEKGIIFIEMIEKWLNENSASWWYRDGDVFVFSVQEDRATFKFWLLADAFDDEYGDVVNNG